MPVVGGTTGEDRDSLAVGVNHVRAKRFDGFLYRADGGSPLPYLSNPSARWYCDGGDAEPGDLVREGAPAHERDRRLEPLPVEMVEKMEEDPLSSRSFYAPVHVEDASPGPILGQT